MPNFSHSQHYRWADLVRVVAIFLVIVVHSSSLPVRISGTSFLPLLSFALAKTCVPLFVMLSGALLLNKNEPTRVFFWKRWLRVGRPWITWTAIYTVVALWSASAISVGKIIATFMPIFSAFWFMPMIFGLYFLTPALRKFVRAVSLSELATVLILWFLGLSLLPYHRNTLAFPTVADTGVVRMVVEYLGYYLLGYWLVSLPHLKNQLRIFGQLLCLGLSWTLLMVWRQSVDNHYQMVMNFYDYIAPGIVLASIGLFGLLRWVGESWQISKHGRMLSAGISMLSQAALGIYFVHALLQKILMATIGYANPLVLPPAIDGLGNGALIFMASFAVIWLMQKIPLIKRIIV